jgi:hypothetical protein
VPQIFEGRISPRRAERHLDGLNDPNSQDVLIEVDRHLHVVGVEDEMMNATRPELLGGKAVDRRSLEHGEFS